MIVVSDASPVTTLLKAGQGTGLLVLAKRANHLEFVRAMIEVLEKQGGLYLSPAVKAEAIKIAGEQQC